MISGLIVVVLGVVGDVGNGVGLFLFFISLIITFIAFSIQLKNEIKSLLTSSFFIFVLSIVFASFVVVIGVLLGWRALESFFLLPTVTLNKEKI